MIFRTLRAKVMDEVLVFMKSKGVQSFGAVTWHLFGIIWISHAWEQHETVAAKRQLKAPYPRVKERINTSQYSFWIFIKDGFRTQILVVYAYARLPHARSRRCDDGQNMTKQCKPFDYLFADILVDLYRPISIYIYIQSLLVYIVHIVYIVRSYWLARSSDRLVSTVYIVSISLI